MAARILSSPYRLGRWRALVVFIPLMLLALDCRSAENKHPVWQDQLARTVKIATVHFGPALGEVARNRQAIVRLTEEAANHGAKIVVHTEMATSGYAFFSRDEISKVAETIPGPTTVALGAVARLYGIYVVVGLPEWVPQTNLYYNTAVLIGPTGEVVGKYHKRNNLLEASYNAEEFGDIPVFDTPYGRIAIVICADLFYSQFPRLAALAGTEILLAPSNVGVATDFLKVRAFEDDFALVVANRYGTETQGAPRHVFNQNTFTIPSPFPYDFSFDSRSVILTRTGEVLADLSAPQDAIGYGILPVRSQRVLPVVRRPELYSLIGQDTLESYTFKQFQLPPASTFAAAAIDPGASANPWQAALAALQNALTQARGQSLMLKLAVFPQGYFPNADAGNLGPLQDFSRTEGVDLVLGIAGVPPKSLLITSDDGTYTYVRTHRGRREPIPPERLSNEFFVIDRPYARVALLQDRDLFAPETSVVMAKMGIDVIAVGADSADSVLSALWQSRTGDYLHIVVANKRSVEGVYLGGYIAFPSFVEKEGLALLQMNTADVRNKKEPRFLNFLPLVRACGRDNC